jgi:hypothetical protein
MGWFPAAPADRVDLSDQRRKISAVRTAGGTPAGTQAFGTSDAARQPLFPFTPIPGAGPSKALAARVPFGFGKVRPNRRRRAWPLVLLAYLFAFGPAAWAGDLAMAVQATFSVRIPFVPYPVQETQLGFRLSYEPPAGASPSHQEWPRTVLDIRSFRDRGSTRLAINGVVIHEDFSGQNSSDQLLLFGVVAVGLAFVVWESDRDRKKSNCGQLPSNNC